MVSAGIDRGVDRVGRAELRPDRQAVVVVAEQDDARRIDEARGVRGEQPDRPVADDDDVCRSETFAHHTAW